MTTEVKRLVLKWPYLLIALLPIIVFAATDALFHAFGDVVDEMPQFFAAFDAHREAGARVTALGTFLLVIGVAIGALGYFVSTLLLLTGSSKLKVIAAFFLALGLGVVILSVMKTREMQDYLCPSFVCTALGYTPELSANGTDAATSNSAQPRVRITNQRGARGCPNRRFRQLRSLLEVEKIATILGVAALVLGSICCLAALPGAKGDAEELAHYEAQSARLNLYLYLSATFLVTGLLFAAAYARWPAFALLTSTAYDAHANAFVGYLGFSYTLLIASFYAPVAAFLAANVRRLKPATPSASNLPDAFKGPLQVLKIASAVFSTALAGALPAILGLGT